MFDITENTFLDNGICKYEDEWGNNLFMKRKGDGFVAKLRFADENVKAKPLYYDPHQDPPIDGAYLHLDFLDGRNRDDEELTNAIRGFTEIVQRWIRMLSDIILFGADNEMVKNANPGMTEQGAWETKVMLLQQYEELAPVMESIFGM